MASKQTQKIRKPLPARKAPLSRNDSVSANVPASTPSGRNPFLAEIIGLQRTVGNRSVMDLMERTQSLSPLADPALQRWAIDKAREQVRNAPSWADDESSIRSMQRELKRLGFYHMRIDGDYGRGTDAALVEAFGGDHFRTMDTNTALSRLASAQPAPGKPGEQQLRYGELFKDGLLDFSLGVGYDEYLEMIGSPDKEVNDFITVLSGKGFKQDAAEAAKIYAEANRTTQPSIGDVYFVKRDALTYNPPAGEPRQIHAVVRLISNVTGTQGAEASKAFREGMTSADISYYSGHGRYGSGMDFDRNFASFVLHDLDKPEQTITIEDYHSLENFLKTETSKRRISRSPWQQFLWRHKRGLLDVDFSNEGNIRINPRNMQPGKFGSNLINWALDQGAVQAVTGETGELASDASEQTERRYRILVFDGCNTKNYETSLRKTPGFGKQGESTAQTFETTRTVYGDDAPAKLAAFLDSILGQQSAAQIVKDMDKAQGYMENEAKQNPSGTIISSGTVYDPRTR